MDNIVTVVYRYYCGNKNICTPDPVRLSADYIGLNVGDTLVIKRDRTTPASARETRFFQESNYDLLEFVDAISYPMEQTSERFNERHTDGIMLKAVKTGETQIQIVPRHNDFQYCAVLKIKVVGIAQ
ncbi:MAG TPA: hypothetical protein VFD15_05400 [Clostridia bacterium]|nr:hypothetical protein [Clostridia bacterium]